MRASGLHQQGEGRSCLRGFENERSGIKQREPVKARAQLKAIDRAVQVERECSFRCWICAIEEDASGGGAIARNSEREKGSRWKRLQVSSLLGWVDRVVCVREESDTW